MVKQTIASIIEAEQKADQIIADALADAKAMSQNATEEAKQIRHRTIESVKQDRQKVTETAEQEAEESSNNIITLGKKQAEKIKSLTKTEEVINLIKDKVLKKYG